ncbi:MAG: response regulator [Desulfobacterales bacterium]|nr:response regulator [Desulfobacterales bacterium]
MKKKILIVEDSPVGRKMIIKCIPGREEYEIIEANDGREGIEKFKETNPDVVFMDLTMPVLDGFEATSRIIALDNDAIVIAITSDVQRKSTKRILSRGAFSVINKPPTKLLMKKVLNAALKRLKTRHGKQDENRDQ